MALPPRLFPSLKEINPFCWSLLRRSQIVLREMDRAYSTSLVGNSNGLVQFLELHSFRR